MILCNTYCWRYVWLVIPEIWLLGSEEFSNCGGPSGDEIELMCWCRLNLVCIRCISSKSFCSLILGPFVSNMISSWSQCLFITIPIRSICFGSKSDLYNLQVSICACTMWYAHLACIILPDHLTCSTLVHLSNTHSCSSCSSSSKHQGVCIIAHMDFMSVFVTLCNDDVMPNQKMSRRRGGGLPKGKMPTWWVDCLSAPS